MEVADAVAAQRAELNLSTSPTVVEHEARRLREGLGREGLQLQLPPNPGWRRDCSCVVCGNAADYANRCWFLVREDYDELELLALRRPVCCRHHPNSGSLCADRLVGAALVLRTAQHLSRILPLLAARSPEGEPDEQRPLRPVLQ